MANNNIKTNSMVMLFFIAIIIILLMDSQKQQVQGMKRQRGDDDDDNNGLHGHYRPIGESESDFLKAQKKAKIINISDNDDDKEHEEPSQLIGVNPLKKHVMQQFTDEGAEEKANTEGQPIRAMFPHPHPSPMIDHLSALAPPSSQFITTSNNNNDNNYDSRKGKKVVIDAAAPPPPLNFHGPPATLQWKQHPIFVPISQQQVMQQQQPDDQWEEQNQQIDYFQQNNLHLPNTNSPFTTEQLQQKPNSALTHFQQSRTFLREDARSRQASLPSQPAAPPFFYNNNNKEKNIAVVLPNTGQSKQQQRQFQQNQQHNGQHFVASTNQSMFSDQFNQQLEQHFINRGDQLQLHRQQQKHQQHSRPSSNNSIMPKQQQQAAIALLHHRQQQSSFPFNNNEFVTNAHAAASTYAVPSFQQNADADHSHRQHQQQAGMPSASFGTILESGGSFSAASAGLAPPLPPVTAAVVIEPSQYLVCILPHGSNIAVGKITLWNKSAQQQLYKLRSTDKNMFLFDSSQSLLMPKQSIIINVTVTLPKEVKFAAALKMRLNNLVPDHHITIHNRATDVPLNIMPARQQWKMNRQPDSEWTLAVQFELETVAVNNDHINV